MGSEGPLGVTIHVTGFKKFHGVSENPTETIVGNLKEYMEKKGLPKGLVLGSCNVLETAGQGALANLYKIWESSVVGSDSESSNTGQVIWLHFGVNGVATRFAIENQAVNEATFRCPDELGWKPQTVPIALADGGILQTREMMQDALYAITSTIILFGFPRFSEEHGTKSLFIHVPLFLTIDEETQMRFVASLLEVLASLN